MINTLNKVSAEGTYLNTIKAIYDKSTSNIILNSEKMKFSSKIKNERRMPTLTTFINMVLKVLAMVTRLEKGTKGIQIGREELRHYLQKNMTKYRMP